MKTYDTRACFKQAVERRESSVMLNIVSCHSALHRSGSSKVVDHCTEIVGKETKGGMCRLFMLRGWG